MAVEYDLVIIGASPAGIEAARLAAHCHARVVLVQQGVEFDPTAIGLHTLQRLGRIRQSQPWCEHLGWRFEGAIAGSQVQTWIQALAAQQQALQDLALVASWGVDVIAGVGSFYRKPRLGFAVNGRQLRSRAYLLALPTNQPPLPPGNSQALQELQRLGYWTVTSLIAALPEALASLGSLIIWGDVAEAMVLAQALNRLGVTITIVTTADQILPDVDPELAHLCQAQLEAEGVTVLTATDLTQIKHIDNQTWIQAGDWAMAADGLLLGTGPGEVSATAMEHLNLAATGVPWHPTGIQHNRYQQTCHRQIYTCCQPRLSPSSERSVKTAVYHALFRVLYRPPPSLDTVMIPLDPPLVRIGLTEPTATHRYGKHLQIYRQSLHPLLKSQLHLQPVGLAKLITRSNGILIGAHLLGDCVDELLPLLAGAIQQRRSLASLGDLPIATPTMAELVAHLTEKAQHQRYRGLWWQIFLEEFFVWRRYWTR
jgi:pyruvate/2-oxoglutarate dehydrogenase complex dihydrolipoamide dehydrogenase (E3) component